MGGAQVRYKTYGPSLKLWGRYISQSRYASGIILPKEESDWRIIQSGSCRTQR